MADVTSALGFRTLQAATFANNTNFFYFATLHAAGSTIASAPPSVYATTGLGELATANGYTAGGKTCGTASVSATTNVDTPDVVWTAATGNLVASYAAFWVNTTNTITGASLVAVKDSSATPQTATPGQPMTAAITNLIAF